MHKVSATIENEIKDQKLWKSTCDWMKKNVLENAKAFTDDVKKLLDEAVVS